jgi:hypothetical protein
MSFKLPDGATVSIASGYGVAKAVTALSNAANAEATLPAGHGLLQAALLVLQSGWLKADQRVARISAVDGADVTLEGIDTSDVVMFPAGSGIGNVRAITAWTQIPQITGFESSGGDQNYANVDFLEDSQQRQIPTSKSPVSLAVTMADDPDKPFNDVLRAADQDREPRVLRLMLANGSAIYYNAYVSFNETPTLTKGSIMAVKANFALVSQLTRYAAA